MPVEGSPRVLIVEDDDTVALVLADLLEGEGCIVRRAADGRAGLELLSHFRPGLILLDLMMPVLDGWGFRAQQRQLAPELADIPVLVLSGAHQARAAAIELGAAGVVSKPFELETVLQAVRAIFAAEKRSSRPPECVRQA